MANDGQAEEGSVSGGGRQPAAGGGCPTALPASDPPLSRRSVAAVFAGLLVAMTVGTLNQTIVATVLPTIVGELGGVNRMLWVTTSYVLAATVTMPLYGKMGDLIGRKGLFIGALALFVAGSAACALAPSMEGLVIGRAVQGLGGGGLMVLSQAIVADVVKNNDPEYDFTAADGFGHKLWVIRDKKTNDRITEIFAGIPALYVADGHHRTAAAARVGQECQAKNPGHTGNEEYCYFLAVTFPAGQLRIIDYNRVVKDLNGLTPEQLLEKLAESFTVEDKGTEEYRPTELHNFSMYLGGHWYSLTAKPGTYDDNDPIGVLDVTVLSNLVLDKILDIKDLRTSKRIDFVGGIRGLGELKRRVDSGEMKAAFALYPVSMQQLINIADTGNIMPPKTTWFEPKLRSGVVIHSFEE